jgi:hypothetical protein
MKIMIRLSSVSFIFLCFLLVSFSPARANSNADSSLLLNDDLKKSDSRELYGLPPGWDYITTDKQHFISIWPSANPNICGIALLPGDYIGVFFINSNGELQCAGAGEWNGVEATFIAAQGDDFLTPEKDGFSPGEKMNWKVFTWNTTQQEYIAFPVLQSGSNNWGNFGMTIVNNLLAYETHEIIIPVGWSGISSYLTPGIIPPNSAPRVAAYMQPILSDLVILQTLTKMYYPSQGINTIINWNVNDGYKIKVLNDVVLFFPGCEQANRSLNLINNWNQIPVKSECNVLVSEIFNPVMNKLILVKEIAGNNVYWPEMGIFTLQILSPGKAYLVAMNQSATIIFPECTGTKPVKTGFNQEFKNESIWPDPVHSPSSHTIAISKEVFSDFTAGDYIGAFTPDKVLAGLTEIRTLEDNVSMTVFGDDPATLEKEGFVDGETLSFKVFRSESKEVVEVKVDFDKSMPDNKNVFVTNGLSTITGIKPNTTLSSR